MFVFNELPCEFQVKKLYRPRKFTCPSTAQAKAKLLRNLMALDLKSFL